MSQINQFTETLTYLRQTDSQRSDNDFHIVHVCDSRPPQSVAAHARATFQEEVMHIARKNAGPSQSSDTRPRSAHLPAGAIPLRLAALKQAGRSEG
jgi:hypothetical protein